MIVLGVLYWRAREAITICVIRVTDGRAKIARGGMAPRVFADLADVIGRPRVVRNRGYAKVEIEGDVSAAQRQQLRNVIGSVPLAKLVNARRS